MSTCKKCNEQISEKDIFCKKCGTRTENELPKYKPTNSIGGFILSLLGFITCGLTSFFGLILSFIGFHDSRKAGEKDGFAIAGLIISLIQILLVLVAIVITFLTAKDVTVADFSTMSKEETKSWCKSNEITCNISEEYSSTVESGKLIRQEVKANKVIKSYESIDIVYSKGEKKNKEIEDTSNSTNNKSTKDTTKEQTKKTKAKEKFSLLDHYVSDESNQFAMYIEGKIKNNKDRDMTYVQVTFITYDSEGNTIGTCIDNNSGLNANGTWKFKAICTDNIDKVDHYELKEITGW